MLLAALLSVAIYLIWQTTLLPKAGSGALIAIDLLLMVVVIEKMIHTTYTVTSSNTLIIHAGKFSKDKIIPISDIDRIDRINRIRIGGKALQTSLAIVMKDQKEYFITPVNEEDFIKCIAKHRS